MSFSDSVDLVLGPLQIGYSVSTFLFGLATVQSYLYFQDFSEDPLLYRTLVGAVWLFELANEICSSHSIYFYTITTFGETHVLGDKAPQSFNLIFLFTGLNALLVFGFFSYRLWESLKQAALALIIGVLAIGQVALYMVLTAFATTSPSVISFIDQRRTFLLATFFVDLGAVFFLTIILGQDLFARKQEEFYRFATSVDQFIMWIIGTGMLASLAAIILAVSFATMRDNLIWHGVFVTLPRLLTMTLLISLNSRDSIHRIDLARPVSLANVGSSNMGSSGRGGYHHQPGKMGTLQIAVETVETTDAASLYHPHHKAEHSSVI